MEDPLSEGLLQHLPVPLLQPLGLGDLLVGRVAVEDVVVPLTGGARPDVPLRVAMGEKRQRLVVLVGRHLMQVGSYRHQVKCFYMRKRQYECISLYY